MYPHRLACTGVRLVLVGSLCIGSAHATTSQVEQLTSLPLEQLLEFQVDTVSKHAQPLSSVPASVSIVTARDIRTFGYRTLGDVLNSMRGLYVSYDRNYNYLGVRGFSTPGDYNTRVLLLVDGVRYNDVVYDQAAIGTDFSIDVDLIERVEFINGPGSVVYGANALLGVINVVTKSGADFRGTNVALEGGSYRTTRGRATIGDITENGGSWLLSATRRNQHGQDLYYSEYDTPEQNQGVAIGADYDRVTTLMAKYQQNNFSVMLTRGDRTKGIPTASYGQTFNDPRSQTIDTHTNLSAQYRFSANRNIDVVTRLNSGYYEYRGDYVYDDSQLINRDFSAGFWSAAEFQMSYIGLDSQTITAGLEYRYAPRIDQENVDVDPRAILLSTHQRSNTEGFYLQDEIRLTPQWTLNLGDRIDWLDNGDLVNSPRIGLVWQPATTTAIKLMRGEAYRAPNAYEQYYFPQFFQQPGTDSEINSGLQRERVISNELIVEQGLSASERISLSVFENEIDRLIVLQSDPIDDSLYFVNALSVRTRGAEIEWQRAWTSGVQLKTSYSWQVSNASGPVLTSPRHLFKLNLSGPLPAEMTYGASLRAISGRETEKAHVPGFAVADLTLRQPISDRLEWSGGLYNVFDHKYFDPASAEHEQSVLAQDRRNFTVRFDYWF